MRKFKFLSLFLALFLLYLWVIPCYASDTLHEADAAPAPPELALDVGAAILMDSDTGEVLYRQNDQDAMYPASTTKIMTCYLALKYLDADASVTIPAGFDRGITAGVSTANLKEGEVLTVYELLECLMIVSANEAANAAAILVSGSIDDFVLLMNQEAAELGCTNTHFVTPNGLHDDDHYTCAEDLATITRAALSYDAFRSICGTAKATIPATNLSDPRELSTTNYLLAGSDYPAYSYAGALGVKTGYTTPAGYCLVAAAQQEGHTLIAVVLGAKKETTSDGKTVSGAFTQASTLMDWGFANYDAALFYQEYLDMLPSPSPEAPAASEEESAEDSIVEDSEEVSVREPDPAPDEEVSEALPEATVEAAPTPSSTAAPAPAPAVSASAPTAQRNAAAMISALAENLGITPFALLLIVLAITVLMLVIVVVVLVLLLKRR